MTEMNPFLERGHEPSGTELVFVLLPGAIAPEEREQKFGEPLDAELRLAGIGYISGGGALQSAPNEDGRCEIIYAGLDVDTLDIDAARVLLRYHLPELGCPVNTRVQHENNQDRYDGADWHLDEPSDEDI